MPKEVILRFVLTNYETCNDLVALRVYDESNNLLLAKFTTDEAALFWQIMENFPHLLNTCFHPKPKLPGCCPDFETEQGE